MYVANILQIKKQFNYFLDHVEMLNEIKYDLIVDIVNHSRIL